MKKEAKEKASDKKVMAYININKRITELAKMELLEEIKPNSYTVNIHGRKDYKLTEKGLLCLEDHIIAHPEDIKSITEYMDKIELDKRELTKLLNDRVASTIYSVNLYRRIIGMDSFVLQRDKEGHITAFIDGKLKAKRKA